jgi:hypothetical protein
MSARERGELGPQIPHRNLDLLLLDAARRERHQLLVAMDDVLQVAGEVVGDRR